MSDLMIVGEYVVRPLDPSEIAVDTLVLDIQGPALSDPENAPVSVLLPRQEDGKFVAKMDNGRTTLFRADGWALVVGMTLSSVRDKVRVRHGL